MLVRLCEREGPHLHPAQFKKQLRYSYIELLYSYIECTFFVIIAVLKFNMDTNFASQRKLLISTSTIMLGNAFNLLIRLKAPPGYLSITCMQI